MPQRDGTYECIPLGYIRVDEGEVRRGDIVERIGDGSIEDACGLIGRAIDSYGECLGYKIYRKAGSFSRKRKKEEEKETIKEIPEQYKGD